MKRKPPTKCGLCPAPWPGHKTATTAGTTLHDRWQRTRRYGWICPECRADLSVWDANRRTK